jgi:hypothetical protein
LGSKVGVTFEDLAIRHMWESKYDEKELLEALIKALYWPIDSPVSSTLLATQILEEMEAFLSWGKDI